MSKIPVTVLTGYLGAGKTTVLDRALAGWRAQRYAVAVNGFGIGIGDRAGATGEDFEKNSRCPAV